MVVWVLVIFMSSNAGGSGVAIIDNIQTAESCSAAKRVIDSGGHYQGSVCLPVRKVPK